MPASNYEILKRYLYVAFATFLLLFNAISASGFNVGDGPYSVSDFYLGRGNYGPAIKFNLTINAAAGPVITANSAPSARTTTYGTPSSASSFSIKSANLTGRIVITAPTGFEVSADGVTYAPVVTLPQASSNTTVTVYIRLPGNSPAGTHSGPILIQSVGAADVNVAMPVSTVIPAPINLFVQLQKNYGLAIPAFQTFDSTSGLDFTTFNPGLKNSEQINFIQASFGAGSAATDPVGTYANAVLASNAQGTNGFLASNYNITYLPRAITIDPAPITIKANPVNKPFGSTLTAGPVTSGYTITGLQNNETITQLTVNYGQGAAANAAAGTYTNSVSFSNPVGGNGFLLSNYSPSYVLADIIVTAPSPTITASGNPLPLTTVYGTPSTTTTFNVSGSGMTAGILVTPPIGFEVSLDGVSFSNSVTIGAAGNITNTPVYIRLKQTSAVNSYSGNIVLSSTGAAGINVAIPNSTVTPAPLTITADTVIKAYGALLAPKTGVTKFTENGLQNNETIGSVTLSYPGPTLPNAGFYLTGALPSLAVGGTFVASNYTITYQGGNLTINRVGLTVIADDKSKIYTEANPALTLTYQGFVNNDDPSKLSAQPVVATTANQSSPAGKYPIIVGGGVSPNYNFSYVPGTLTIIQTGLPITVPNAFTPNGDGINDTWDIANLSTYPASRVQIFNRNGTVIYNTIGYPSPWDGRYKGVNIPAGVYYYLITLQSGQTPVSGYVAVIR